MHIGGQRAPDRGRDLVEYTLLIHGVVVVHRAADARFTGFRAEEIILDRLTQDARPIIGRFVLRMTERDRPVVVAPVAAQAAGGINGLFLENADHAGAFVATDFGRREGAGYVNAGFQVGVVEHRAGPAEHAGVRFGFLIPGDQAGEGFKVVAQIESAVHVQRAVLVAVTDRLIRGRFVECAGGAELGYRAGAGVGAGVGVRVELAEVVAAGRATGKDVVVGGGGGQGAVTDAQAGARLHGRTDRRCVGPGVHEIALDAEDHRPFQMLEGVGDAPGVAGEAANPFQVIGVAATLGRFAGFQRHRVAVEILAQDNVDDAGDCVRAVNGRGAAAQYFDALDGGRRDGAEVHRIALAVVGQRVVGDTAAVDQHQSAARAQRAQVDDGSVGREAATGVQVVLGRAEGFGQRGEGVSDSGKAFVEHLLAGQHGHRRCTLDVGTFDARAGHFDAFRFASFGSRRGTVGGVSGAGQQAGRQQQGKGCGQRGGSVHCCQSPLRQGYVLVTCMPGAAG